MLNSFAQAKDRAWSTVEAILARAPASTAEQSLKGALSKSSDGDLQPLLDLATKMGESDFLDLVTGNLLSYEEAARQEAETKDTRRVKAWVTTFSLATAKHGADKARILADRDTEVRRLTSLAEEANARREDAERKAGKLRVQLDRARKAAAGILLPQTETEWLVFWKIHQPSV